MTEAQRHTRLLDVLTWPFVQVGRAVAAVVRLGAWVLALPLRVVAALVRVLGFKGFSCLVVGIALGLFLAPGPGRELRTKVLAALRGASGPSDADLAERVTFELAHAPRTWHLPQPTVTVSAGRVVLAGAVPQDAARDELARVAAAIPGVREVENLLEVSADELAGAAG
ncbi:MAG: BON domain-containing protein [Acidimicrobiales bacterium]|jgi:hypothetical protein|nr:BON domain-containing protein [Acidimicrobiales bacterium]